jgi:L-idonate 5-dehydrogenase
MKALVCHGPRDLRVTDVPVPEPGPEQLLVKVQAGGVCGSDLHYYQDGGFGAIRIREPMVLGHEVAGTIVGAGKDGNAAREGERIAINPSRPCGHCNYCKEARFNHCLNMRFYGSAMPFPHIQGAFSEFLVIDESQAAPVGSTVDIHHAAMAEPLSVALHALRQAGNVGGKRVLVTGCGPIGILCIVAARFYGALSVTATDIVDEALVTARAVGAETALNVSDAEILTPYMADKGWFDVVVEASGTSAALASALNVVRPGGTIVQLGLGGDFNIPMNTVVAKEIRLTGSFRFHEEFHWAASLIADGRVDLSPVLSDVFPADQAIEAFEHAGDRTRAMKVQVTF